MRFSTRRTLKEETGSIPLALLAIIVIGGLMAVLTSRVIMGQRTTLGDQRFTQALHRAEGGLEAGMFAVRTGSSDTSGSSSSGDYEWTTTNQAPAEPLRWTVTATGEVGGTERTLSVELEQRSRFAVAVFADKRIVFRGNNGASSYDSRSGAKKTGNGVVGTNGQVSLLGKSTTVDGSYLYNWAADPSPERCSGNCAIITYIDEPLALASDEEMAFIEEGLDACSGPLLSWKASLNAGMLQPGTQCYDSMDFDQSVTLAQPAQETILFVRGGVSFANDIAVNCCGSNTPTSSNLQIYVLGETDSPTGGAVKVGNRTDIAAAIYAPRSACGGNPSNARANLYGSLYCASVENQGGWSFYYDDALGEIGGGFFETQRWTED
jgi:hypothetical protein